MPESGQVSGSVFLRPVRLGHVMVPDLNCLVAAVERATCSWGGVFHVMLESDSAEDSLAWARSMGVDALWPADDHHLSKRIAETAGFQWTGWHGPFEETDGVLQWRLLDTSWLLDEPDSPLLLPTWSDDDPLSALFAVWFGKYPDSDIGKELSEKFVSHAYEAPVNKARPVHIFDETTPILVTRFETKHRADHAELGLVVLDPQTPGDLMRFWNLRSMGCDVFPWAIGVETRLVEAARQWLKAKEAMGAMPRPRSGAGQVMPPVVRVWMGEAVDAVPQQLRDLIESEGYQAWPGAVERPRWWSGSHPLRPEASRSFVATVDNASRSFRIALPQFHDLHGRRPRTPGVVAAQLEFDAERGTGPGWSALVPNSRALSPLLQGVANLGAPFIYPTYDGCALSVRTDDEGASVDLVPSMRIFEQLFSDAGWKTSQSDAGRFATRLIELLGGAGTHLANQPAVRGVINYLSRKPHGAPLPALVEQARKHAGAWPGGLMSIRRDNYPTQVVSYLVSRKLLHPVLPVRCPTCATLSPVTPETLGTEVECLLCGDRFPLGLAFIADKRREWHYRLAPSVPEERMTEALPMMAALNIMASMSSGSLQVPPHILGLELKGSDLSCEIDIALGTNDGGPAAFVLGEVKSHGTIDTRDVANLERVQNYLRGTGLDCYVLVATLREALTADEVTLLRGLCDRSGTVQSSVSLEPLLPIVLVNKDLSVPSYTENHPATTGRGFRLHDIAYGSCERNLGLVSIESWPRPNHSGWTFAWSDADLRNS